MQDELLNTQDRLTRRRGFARWALIATLLAAVVVMLGAWTRLVDAGLGCPDWPGCYGFLHVPQTPAQIAIAEARFPEAPVDVAKGWPEMIHRYFAGSLGLVILGMTVFAIRHRREALPVRHCIGLLALVTLQAAFGMWTVTLQLWPQIVATHLLGGFATLSLLFLLALRMSAHHPPLPILAEQRLLRLRPWLWLSLLLVIAQIALGAWTAANYAAVACTDVPGCHGALWPEMDVR
ncbi:MAG: COX15/CtaA family protein, partial [Gammaproteobacteria bacterium]|nr:COX15/CtaA family protein [Gammaproteobacteria bacterium]